MCAVFQFSRGSGIKRGSCNYHLCCKQTKLADKLASLFLTFGFVIGSLQTFPTGFNLASGSFRQTCLYNLLFRAFGATGRSTNFEVSSRFRQKIYSSQLALLPSGHVCRLLDCKVVTSHKCPVRAISPQAGSHN